MADNLFQGLPPPSAPPPPPPPPEAPADQPPQSSNPIKSTAVPNEGPQNPPRPALKSALKRTKAPDSEPEAPAPKKRLSFKTTTDASEKQVIDAMKKIASHITNVSKFSKASKLAIQLVQAGSVKPATGDYFFAILEAAMSPLTTCNIPSVRADYHALFSAAQDTVECFNKQQRNQFTAWTIRAIVANDLFTDDSFVEGQHWIHMSEIVVEMERMYSVVAEMNTLSGIYGYRHGCRCDGSCLNLEDMLCDGTNLLSQDIFGSDFGFSKACGKVKESISNLPVATNDDDIEEAAALKDETEAASDMDTQTKGEISSVPIPESSDKEEPDPFGLDSLLPSSSKKDEKIKGRRDTAAAIKTRKDEEEENRRSLKSEREALILCLEIAAKRYKIPWCQTVIDILVKHAFDNVSRFTSKQRDAIGELWASIREQQTRRRQGKSVSGKLEVNGFEWLQQKYAGEKISIRHSVGGGTRRAEQWLG